MRERRSRYHPDGEALLFEIAIDETGLVSRLADRVEALGGRLEIESEPGASRVSWTSPPDVSLPALRQEEDHRLDALVNGGLPGQPELEEDRVDDLLDRPLREYERCGDRRRCSSLPPSRGGRPAPVE